MSLLINTKIKDNHIIQKPYNISYYIMHEDI